MPKNAIRDNLAAFKSLKTNLFHKDFLLTWEHPEEEIKAILTLADTFKRMHQAGQSVRAFDTGLAISILFCWSEIALSNCCNRTGVPG